MDENTMDITSIIFHWKRIATGLNHDPYLEKGRVRRLDWNLFSVVIMRWVVLVGLSTAWVHSSQIFGELSELGLIYDFACVWGSKQARRLEWELDTYTGLDDLLANVETWVDRCAGPLTRWSAFVVCLVCLCITYCFSEMGLQSTVEDLYLTRMDGDLMIGIEGMMDRWIRMDGWMDCWVDGMGRGSASYGGDFKCNILWTVMFWLMAWLVEWCWMLVTDLPFIPLCCS